MRLGKRGMIRMFFDRKEKKAEEFAKLEIRKRLYNIECVILEEGLMNSVTDGKSRIIINPWLEDDNLVKEMLDHVTKMTSEQFVSAYGADLEDLENNYIYYR